MIHITNDEQGTIREEFIRKGKKQAWETFCQCAFMSTRLKSLQADIAKDQAMAAAMQGEVEKLETSADYHTVENREKRKQLAVARQSILDKISQRLPSVEEKTALLRKGLEEVEALMQLADFAGTWDFEQAVSGNTEGEDTNTTDAEVAASAGTETEAK